VDHDRTEADSDDANYSHVAWPGFGKTQRHATSTTTSKKSRVTTARSQQFDSGTSRRDYDIAGRGPYDSPYASPPGPYDSPESDAELERSAVEKPETSPRLVLTGFFLIAVVVS